MANAVGSKIKPVKFSKSDLKSLSSDGSEPTVQDLLIPPEQASPVANMPSNLNAAAQSAALSDNSGDAQKMIDTYRGIAAEYTDMGQSYHAMAIQQDATNKAMQANGSGVIDLMADPAVSDEAKLNTAKAVYDKTNVMYSPANMLSSKALSTPPINPPSNEGDLATFDSALKTAAVNQRKADMQKVYNQAVTANDPSLKDKIISFGMSLLPFSNAYILSNIRSDTNGLNASAFVKTIFQGVGSTEQELRQHIASLPPDQRLEAARHMADIINSHSGIIMSTPNEFARRDFLQNILGGQGYSHEDEVTDNLVNWTQDLFSAAGVAKGAGKAIGTISTLKSESAFTKAFNANLADARKTMDNVDNGVIYGRHEKDVEPPAAPFKGIGNTASTMDSAEPVASAPSLVDTNAGPEPVVPATSVVDTHVDPEPVPTAIISTKRPNSSTPSLQKFYRLRAKERELDTKLGPKSKLSDAISEGIDNPMSAPPKAPEPEAPTPTPKPYTEKRPNNTTPSLQKLYRQLGEERAANNDMGKESALSSAIRDVIKSSVQPVSIINNVKDYSPDMARNMYESINLDDTEEAAKALTGTNRADALANPVLPEVEHLDGSVNAKVSAPDAISQMNNPVIDSFTNFATNDGMTQYTQTEKAAARSWKQQQFADAVGVTPRGEMFQLINPKSVTTDTPHGFTFRGVYGPQENGFADAQEALDTAKFALRNTGIDESKLGLLMRDGDRYVKVSLDEVNSLVEDGEKIPNDFLVTVDHDYHIGPHDITEAEGWEPINVRLNYLDRHLIGAGHSGKLNDYFIDKASQLPPHMVGSAVVNTDKASRIERDMTHEIGEIAVQWKKLGKNKQQLLLNEIQEANYASRDYDYGRLVASGASNEDIALLRRMKNYWDGIWNVKNQYFTKQLQKEGWQEFIEPTTNTSLPAKAAKLKPKGSVKVYDPVTDTIHILKSTDVDHQYAIGGGLAKLRWPHIDQSGDIAEYVVHGNNPAGGYLKSFGPHSQVLQYRKGYYPVEYTDAFHIVERVSDGKGGVAYERSVATANQYQEADLTARRMSNASTAGPFNDGKPQYYFRKNRALNTEDRFTHELDVNQAQGNTNFRRRGKLLDDSTSNVTTLANAHVRSPIETMIRQAMPLSNKMAMDDTIEAMYQRAIAQWGDLLPKGKFNQPMIPTDLRQIKYRDVGNQDAKAVADARTVIGYANYLRNGYVNVLDDKIKGLMHAMADTLGKAGAGKAEQATRYFSDRSLTNGLKSLAYYTSIGLAPLRQAVIQGHQAVMLGALNPSWIASAAAHSQALYVSLRTMGILANHPVAAQLAKAAWGDSKRAEEAFKHWTTTGLGSAVDKQNMVTGAVNDMAKNMLSNARQDIWSKATYGPRAVVRASQKVGFEAGEFYSNLMSWLAHRDLAEKAGANLNDTSVADKITADSRNYTGNMNNAGDLPQNKNALAFIMQFTQATQKMLLGLTTNRSIPWQTKARMGALSIALFGIPSAVVYNTWLNNVQDPNARELVRYGLESWTMNKMLSMSSGQKSQIDWRGLNPYGLDGLMELTHTMLTGSLGSIVVNSPGVSLLAGNNPRVANFLTDLGKYFNLVDDHKSPVEFHQVAMDFAKIASGMSAAFKTKYLLEYKKKVSSTGTITQEGLDRINAVGTALGMPTEHESDVQFVTQQSIDDANFVKDAFNHWFPSAQRAYSDSNVSGDELGYVQKVHTEFYRVFGNGNPELQHLLEQKLTGQLMNGDAAMYNNILRNCEMTKGTTQAGSCEKLINAAPFTDEQSRANLLDLIKSTDRVEPH